MIFAAEPLCLTDRSSIDKIGLRFADPRSIHPSRLHSHCALHRGSNGRPDNHRIAPAETTKTSPGGPILDKISRNNTVAINVADVRVRMEQQGALPITNTPDQCDAIMKTDSERKYESYPSHRRGGQSVITLGKNVQGDR